ncbi:hypothetical protein B0H63DRAFT_505413 [Podospora didyma]|uniref:Rhodopsin domain-containing protein n=1 Tax=Podospora didyma TaxID=330526 RepID=A0AAE0P5V4_9PEZI|nr:hypothetical protein B0H63DRAFT_505413 [Podospora didyma]
MSTPLDPSLYESRAHVPITVVAVTLSVAFLTVAARTYARAVIIRSFGMDDWAAIAAVIFAIGSGGLVASNTIYGAGRHIAVVDPKLLGRYFRTFYISIVLYNAALTATKIAFLLQYYRIFGTPYMRRVILIALALVAMWSISQLLVVIFSCTPIEKFWLGDSVPGTCIPNLPFWYINAAGNIATDVVVFVLPLPALSRLNLRMTQKLMLLGIFSLGFFTCAISVLRIQYLRLSDDVTWDNVESSCWSVGELCSGITCLCLPTLRPLLAKIIPSMGSTAKSTAKYVQQSSGRDGTGKSAETSSSRGIVYPEDVELQAADSDNADPPSPRTHADSLKLGLRSMVRTEIKVGSPVAQRFYTRQADGGIEVKRDVIMTKEAS